MPTVRSSFTPNGQNFEIPKIDFCDVITSVLYSIRMLELGQKSNETESNRAECHHFLRPSWISMIICDHDYALM